MTTLHRVERLARRGLIEMASPRHARSGMAIGGTALGATVLGVAALGAFAIGALAIGRVVARDVRIEHLSVGQLEIDHGRRRGPFRRR